MKKMISLFLVCTLLVGCTVRIETEGDTTDVDTTADAVVNMNDPSLVEYINTSVKGDIAKKLDVAEYTVEDVEAVYLSKEYIEEMEYNSQSNIYFGHTLSEFEGLFENDRYVFTLGEDGTTVVREIEECAVEYQKSIENIAKIVGGVVLVLITVKAIDPSGKIRQVSFLVSMATKVVKNADVWSDFLSSLTSCVIEGVRTGDYKNVIQSALIDCGTDFVWNALIGSKT